ncbi:TetR family transcriptional regulator [Mesorhizobium sp.]|uniref:TetR family transcriptional regulator n=1 Tax=Mesorhizobium sp. TaxID=1871066 RepID=UPI0012112031|nr:MAG: helix-turn-helix transcriptional regulator [Mesorhizobium sp.]
MYPCPYHHRGRNHEALIEAPPSSIWRHAFDVHIKEIADRAGVGGSTLYRRFPRERNYGVCRII